MALSNIEWTDYTNNAWDGCTNVAPECDNCYAEARNARFSGGEPENFGAGKPRKRHEPATRNAPRKWNRAKFVQCESCGWRGPLKLAGKKHAHCAGLLSTARARVFAQSLSDTFDNEVPQQWRDELFALMEECTNLDWLVLTKRIGNVRKMVPARWLELGGWPRHIRLGVTAGTQKAADRDIPQLLALPCPNFVSMEPLLEAVSIARWLVPQCDNGSKHVPAGGVTCMRCNGNGPSCPGLQWVIVGGESGRGEGIRPMYVWWVRALRDECADAGVPFLFKQWGEWMDNLQMPRGVITSTAQLHRWNGDHYSIRLGKKRTGRLLDGRTHDGFPEALAA